MRETPQFEQKDSLAENSKSTVNPSTFQSQDCSVLTNRRDELDQGDFVQALVG